METGFKQYVAKQQQKLMQYYRAHFSEEEAQQRLAITTPFQMDSPCPNGDAVLLVHGLFDCPYSMRALGHRLAKAGYEVKAILLPGHGTSPQDLLHIDYQEWVNALTYTVERYFYPNQKVGIVGFSTGGALAVHHAAQTRRLNPVITIAPALKLKTRLGFMANWHKPISWAWPRAAWLHKSIEDEIPRYQSVPFNAGYQVHRLIKAINKLPHPKVPMMTIVTDEDEVIHAGEAINYLRHHQSHKKAIVYTKKPQKYCEEWIECRPASYPEKNIVSMSHISLPFDQSDNIYGDKSKLMQGEEDTIYGALDNPFHHRLKKKGYQRITYNPDFDHMAKSIIEFIYRYRY